ncbi:MAG: GNAT family N-acetyltransferase [Bacteroidota bacterium]
MDITISNSSKPGITEVIALYKALKWSAAEKPELLYKALMNSHSLVTARGNGELVGIGNAISDGHLVVYYPHLLVHPDYQGKGIGQMIMEEMFKIYEGFHMQMLTADGKAIDFYSKMGFQTAGNTVPMWIYDGNEH